MRIRSDYVGIKLLPYNIEISTRRSMNYAAGVGDDNPAYFDDERPQGLLAPPALAGVLSWDISSRLWDYFTIPDFPFQLLSTQVHYLEYLAFHRPLVPGQRLVIQGQVAAIYPHRAGTHFVIRYDAFDQDRAPVYTEFTGALLRGVECADQGRGSENIPTIPADPPEQPALWTIALPISHLAAHVYDGCADVTFPIHSSVQFAHQVGLPGILFQGSAILALAVRELIDRQAGGDPARLAVLSCRFGGMVFPGTTVRLSLDACQELPDGAACFFTMLNDEGRPAIRNGYALIRPT